MKTFYDPMWKWGELIYVVIIMIVPTKVVPKF